MTEPGIVVERTGRIGRLTLDRPRALNALDLPMIRRAADALATWTDDPAVHCVVIEGAGGRAFCAGGDIRAVRAAALDHRFDEIATFFGEEYALNQTIASYPKPVIAIVDGICMGGGIGMSVHGSARIVTEAALFAMPETGIGLFPDIGASHILPRLRGQVGMYMALTGARMTGADAVFVGLATHFVERSAVSALPEAIAEHGEAVLAGAALQAHAPIAQHMDVIDHCFGASSVIGIVARLAEIDTEWSRQTVTALRSMSPSAVLWTFEIIRAGAGRTLPQCFAAELALTGHVTRHPDFVEGVRAMVVDKDRRPLWSPATIEAVDPGLISGFFADQP